MRRLSPATLLTTLLLALAPAGAQAARGRSTSTTSRRRRCSSIRDGPLKDRYASLGVHFAGPAANDGGTVLDVSTFAVTGQSAPNALAFNTSANYSADAGGGVPRGPETISVRHADPHRVDPRRADRGRHGAADRVRRHDAGVARTSRPSQSNLQSLDVAAARITSLRLEFSGTATVWDDLTWTTSPVSANDAFGTPANTALTVSAPGVLGERPRRRRRRRSPRRCSARRPTAGRPPP